MSYTVTCGFITKAFEDAESAATYIMENIPEDIYDEMLDDCYEAVEICGYKYSPSLALYRVDKVAYDCGYNDYCDSLYSDIKDTISHMEAGDSEEMYRFTVQCEEDK